jgi:hypothetical protein
VEINEVLEGRGEKIEKDVANRKREIDPNSPEYGEALNKMFGSTFIPLEDSRNEYKSLKGKTHKDIKISNNFGVSGEKAKQNFEQIVGQHDYQSFNFFPQKSQQIQNPNYNPLIDDPSEEFISSSSQTESSNKELDEFQQARRFLIDDIKQHANEFELKPVLTFNGHRYDAINKR